LKDNSSITSITISVLKSKGKICMVQEPSHAKQLSLNRVCGIWLSLESHYYIPPYPHYQINRPENWFVPFW
jgi:hypothetical protein